MIKSLYNRRSLFLNSAKQVIRIDFNNEINDQLVTIRLTDADMIQGSFVWDRTSVGGNNLELGSAVASQIEFKLLNTGYFKDTDGNSIPVADITFAGVEMNVQLGIMISGGSSPVYEYTQLGYFIVNENPKKRSIISITALDRMVYLDLPVNWDVFSSNRYYIYNRNGLNILGMISDVLSIQMIAPRSNPNCYYLVDMDKVKENMGDDNGYTYRELIQFCCQILGCCAYFNNEGKLAFKWYSSPSPNNVTIDTDVRFDSDNEDEIAITGVVLEEGESRSVIGSDDYAFLISDNILITDFDNFSDQPLTNVYNAVMGSTNLPAGYTRVEYVDTNGAYLDTGMSATRKLKFLADVALQDTTGARGLFGVQSNSGSRSYAFNMRTNYSQYHNRPEIVINGSEYANNDLDGNDTTRNTWYIDMNDEYFYFEKNGVMMAHASREAYGLPTGSIYLFARDVVTYNGDTEVHTAERIGKYRVYDFRILGENLELLKHYVPCKYLGTAGLYEVVDGVFYSGSGGSFVTDANEYDTFLRYTPFSCDTLSMPYIEPFDIIQYRDYDGNLIDTLVTGITFHMNGNCDIEAVGESQQNQNYSQVGRHSRETAIIQKAKNDLETSVNTRAEAIMMMSEMVNRAMGLYRFTVQESDGSTSYYMTTIPTVMTVDENDREVQVDAPLVKITQYFTDHPDDNEAIIYKFDSFGIHWTKGRENWINDVWENSINADGNAILNRIYAEGIEISSLNSGYHTLLNPSSFQILQGQAFVLGLIGEGRSQINKLKIASSTVVSEEDDSAYIEIGSVRLKPSFNLVGDKQGMDIVFMEV